MQSAYIQGVIERVKKNLPEYQYYLIGWVLVILFFICASFALSKVYKYEETSYDGYGHADAVDIASYFFQAKKECQKIENAAEKNSCHSAVKVIVERYAAALDLASQDTMAKATRGILWVSFLQALSGFATVLFLFWTVWQTRAILKEAKDTTIAAHRSADAAEKGVGALIFVTVDFELCRATPFKPAKSSEDRLHGKTYGRPIVSLKNYGQTPARGVQVNIFFEPFGRIKEGKVGAVRSLKKHMQFPILERSESQTIETPIVDLWHQDEIICRIRVELTYFTVFTYPDGLETVERLAYYGRMHLESVKTQEGVRTYVPSGMTRRVEKYNKDDY